MSPTHHSSPSPTSPSYPSSLANFALSQTNGIAKQNPIDSNGFSCLSKSPCDTYNESQNGLFPNIHENNNSLEPILNQQNGIEKDLSHCDSNGISSSELKGAEGKGTFTCSDSKQKEDDHYLGVGGFSEWRGEGETGTWVRKLGYAEKFMTGAMDFGVMSTVYNLWFDSKQKVNLETIEKTCYTVAR